MVPEQLQLSGQSAGSSEPGTLGLIPSDCYAVFSLFCLIPQQCVDVEHSYLCVPTMLNPLYRYFEMISSTLVQLVDCIRSTVFLC